MSDNQPYLHLTSVDVWTQQAQNERYVPATYEDDGFIHLTIGEANLMEVANLFYKDDPREYLVLTIDRTKITAPVRFDDNSGRYPHVYGPLNTDAVVAVSAVRRAADGTFLGLVRP